MLEGVCLCIYLFAFKFLKVQTAGSFTVYPKRGRLTLYIQNSMTFLPLHFTKSERMQLLAANHEITVHPQHKSHQHPVSSYEL